MTSSQTEHSQLDLFDLKIIRELQLDGRIPITKLANNVGLSKSPCQVRLAKMRESGVIKGFQAIVDHSKLGNNHITFVEIKLVRSTNQCVLAFGEAVMKIPEIEQCHMTAGDCDYLMKVRNKDITHYQKFLGSVISQLPYVLSAKSIVSLGSVKEHSF